VAEEKRKKAKRVSFGRDVVGYGKVQGEGKEGAGGKEFKGLGKRRR
jgi:nuclear GTP-binding protein